MAGANLATLVADLNDAVAAGSNDRRVAMLRRITDLFAACAPDLGEEQVDAFDEVIVRLATGIEAAARRDLSMRLAPIANAPHAIVVDLALDRDVTVARPVLAHSTRLTDSDLVRVVEDRGDEHRFVIAGRPELSMQVTDALVTHGDNRVLRNLAANAGAALSGESQAVLAEKAATDPALLATVRRRTDVPPAVFTVLLAKAAERVNGRLAESGATGREAVADIADKLAVALAARERAFAEAAREVLAIQAAGRLTEGTLLDFAARGAHEHAIAAFAILCRVPLEAAKRFFGSTGVEPILIVARGNDLQWPTVRTLLRCGRDGVDLGERELVDALDAYERLSPQTAQRILRFWQARDSARQPAGGT